MSNLIDEIYEGILDGNQNLVIEKVGQAVLEGISAEEILNKAMIAAMGEAGSLFEQGEFFVPELLVAARAMQGGMVLLKPLLSKENVKSKGVVLAGTVKGDLHDIGKNLVCMMLEGSGFDIVDLGNDVDPQQFVETVKARNVDIVALSALLTTTMVNMKTTIDALTSAGVRGKIKIMVGGAPVSQDFANKIGADGYAADANQAVRLAESLINNGAMND
ncbi:MAG: cobalamin-binding protein [Anaerolineaceae bacterium]|jgi:5-methyltetrahydrofolate--homocysteine methyltransferase|nr:MAG: cobalamin-binding protein [Anaerolineaceae bacterium]